MSTNSVHIRLISGVDPTLLLWDKSVLWLYSWWRNTSVKLFIALLERSGQQQLFLTLPFYELGVSLTPLHCTLTDEAGTFHPLQLHSASLHFFRTGCPGTMLIPSDVAHDLFESWPPHHNPAIRTTAEVMCTPTRSCPSSCLQPRRSWEGCLVIWAVAHHQLDGEHFQCASWQLGIYPGCWHRREGCWIRKWSVIILVLLYSFEKMTHPKLSGTPVEVPFRWLPVPHSDPCSLLSNFRKSTLPQMQSLSLHRFH